MTKIQIYFVVFKKMVFDDKNLDLFCSILKKMVFDDKNSDLCFISFKRMKNIFLRREFHS